MVHVSSDSGMGTSDPVQQLSERLIYTYLGYINVRFRIIQISEITGSKRKENINDMMQGY